MCLGPIGFYYLSYIPLCFILFIGKIKICGFEIKILFISTQILTSIYFRTNYFECLAKFFADS